jgi:predicted AAA+ superfamily ATPase
MIERKAFVKLKSMAEKFPVLVLTGPRQSGKTTLAKMTFPTYRYVSLENPQNLQFALSDPTGFLAIYDQHCIIDEVQNAPQLFSYIQEIVDDSKLTGHYILSGSQNFLLLEKITQTLAGRVYIMELLPLCHSEIVQVRTTTIEEELFNGSYPRLYDMDITPRDFYPGYIKTYVERDVRSIINVQDLKSFRKFLSLLAHYAGQLFNASQLAKKLSIESKTVQRWLSLLETSYIAFTLQPWHNNLSKRVIKTPKLYFFDTGLLCNLFGIKSAEELMVSPYKGAIFENYILLELMKEQKASGKHVESYFWRDSNQNEIDLLVLDGQQMHCIEMKASLTVRSEHIRALHYLDNLVDGYDLSHYLVNFYDETQQRSNETILSWKDTASLLK